MGAPQHTLGDEDFLNDAGMRRIDAVLRHLAPAGAGAAALARPGPVVSGLSLANVAARGDAGVSPSRSSSSSSLSSLSSDGSLSDPTPPLGPGLVPSRRGFSSSSSPAGVGGGSSSLPSLACRELWAHAPPPPDHPTRTLVILHGLLGTGRNLQTFTRHLLRAADEAERRAKERRDSTEPGNPDCELPPPAWRALMPDVRCHGSSARLGLPGPNDLRSAAGDVIRLLESSGVDLDASRPLAIIGHSMGGKIAMEMTGQLGAMGRGPAVAWSLDSWPSRVNPANAASQDVFRVLAAAKEASVRPAKTREEYAARLREAGLPDPGLQAWLCSSLSRNADNEFELSMDLPGCESMYRSYCDTDYLPMLEQPPHGTTFRVLRGLASDRWSPKAVALLRSTARRSVLASGAVDASRVPDPIPATPDVPIVLPAHLSDPLKAPLAPGVSTYEEITGAGHWVHVDQPKRLLKLILPTLPIGLPGGGHL